jgi:hypothetical protein
LILSLAQLLILLTLGVMLFLAIWYRPAWAVFAAISVASLLDCFGVATSVDGTAASSGVNLYGDDVACLILLAAGTLLIFRHPKRLSRDEAPCFLLLIVIALSVARGLDSFGLKQAGNSARGLCTFVAPAIAIMLLRPVLRLDAGRLARWLGWTGFCVSAIAILRWTGILAIPEQYVILSHKELREVVRVLPSDYAMIVGQAFIAWIYLLIVDRQRTWWAWVSASLFGVVTLCLQHRSVWAATAAGLMWLAFRTSKVSPVRWFGFASTVGVVLGLIMIADPAILRSAGEMLSTGLSETRGSHSTWAWRVDGYSEAIDRFLDSEFIDTLLGPPAGWAKNSGGSFASIHIHSRYVDTLAYYGAIGTAILLLWFIVLLVRCSRRPPSSIKTEGASQGSLALLQALLISELIYLIPYFGGLLQGSVLGLLWIAATHRKSRRMVRQPAPARVQACLATDSVVGATSL